MRLTSRSVATLTAALLLAGGLTACGGSGDAKKIVSDTFSGHKKVDSANLALALDVTPRGGSSGPVSIKLSGPFQNQGANQVPRFDFNLAITVKGQALSAGAVSTGDAGYLKFQGQAYSVPPQVFTSFQQGVQRANAQRKQSPANQGTLAQFGVNPQSWLKNPTTQGSADVGGTSTDHVSSEVDVPRLLADINTIVAKAGSLGLNTGRVPTTLTPQQIQAAQSSIKQAHLDLYSAKSDHSLRRLTLDVDAVPKSGTAAGYHVDLQLTGLNAPQTIGAPASPQPLSSLTSAIRTLTGGAGLGGVLGGGSSGGSGTSGPSGSSGSGSATPSPKSSANAQAYLQCVQAAGADTAKASQCLSLLSK